MFSTKLLAGVLRVRFSIRGSKLYIPASNIARDDELTVSGCTTRGPTPAAFVRVNGPKSWGTLEVTDIAARRLRRRALLAWEEISIGSGLNDKIKGAVTLAANNRLTVVS